MSAWAILRNRQAGGSGRAAAGGEVSTLRHPDCLPDERMEAICREAGALASAGRLSSAAEIDAFMAKNGVKHISDRAKINDVIYRMLGFR